MTDEDIRQVVEDGTLGLDVAISYLNIYVGTCDWQKYIGQLLASVSKKNKDYGPAMRQALSCAILLPYIDRSTFVDADHPENLLLKIPWYHQINDRDWFKSFQETLVHDQAIKQSRLRCWSLGVIDPLEFSPNTRQAFNWLYMKAEEAGDITPANKEEVSRKFKNLVNAYGGAVICGIFTRNADVLKKIINWRSGYFFERVIFDVYTEEQILKIKKRELDNASQKLVKRVKMKVN